MKTFSRSVRFSGNQESSAPPGKHPVRRLCHVSQAGSCFGVSARANRLVDLTASPSRLNRKLNLFLSTCGSFKSMSELKMMMQHLITCCTQHPTGLKPPHGGAR